MNPLPNGTCRGELEPKEKEVRIPEFMLSDYKTYSLVVPYSAYRAQGKGRAKHPRFQLGDHSSGSFGQNFTFVENKPHCDANKQGQHRVQRCQKDVHKKLLWIKYSVTLYHKPENNSMKYL